MKAALVQYWLVGMLAGEKVVEEGCRLHPDADIFIHFSIPENLSDTIRSHKVKETFIAKLPGAQRHYQKFLPFMPKALKALDPTDYDLLISIKSGPAKSVFARTDALHVRNVHSPTRHTWDQYHVYRAQAGISISAANGISHTENSSKVRYSKHFAAFIAKVRRHKQDCNKVLTRNFK